MNDAATAYEEWFSTHRAEMVFICMGCPIHGDGEPKFHSEICGDDCYDTHAYWLEMPR